MPRFLVDEDLPRSLAPALQSAGIVALDVRDEGLRGESDARIFRHAQDRGLTVLTGDLEFANELAYPPADHHGVLLVRFPNTFSAPTVVRQVVGSVASLGDEDLTGAIVIVEPGRVRIRRNK